MRIFTSLSAAILKGFLRDRVSVFFSVVFPLMFLVLFGGVFNFEDAGKLDLVVVGEVAVVDQLSGGAKQAFEETFEIERTDDLDAALERVSLGETGAAIQMRGDTVVAHYSQTDRQSAGVVVGTLRSFVDAANLAVTGQPPTFAFEVETVEDESLSTIQFVTPGLLGWAIAMSAAFGAAATLQGWRQTKLLRRLQLSPAPTSSVVAARVVVSLGVALMQMVIFLGLAVIAFGMQLTGSWWMAVPLILAGTLAFMSLGLLSGALAKTAEGAVNLANFFVLPMAFLSGSFFPLEAAPDWLQVISKLLPLRHLNDGMLDVMVRGLGPSAAVWPLLILIGFALVVGAIAVKMFRWDAD